MEDSKTEIARTAERYAKAQELMNNGINPYPYAYKVTHKSKEILQNIKLEPEQKSGKFVSVAGRVMQLRKMGKATFFHLQDQEGRIQIYVREEDVGVDNYVIVRKLDLGDFIGVEGEIFATKTGEISVYCQKITLLTKSVRDLPDKYHGLKDQELRYRNRYLDLIMNQEVREIFVKRSMIVSYIRKFFAQRGFMEVETPLLQTQYGGANARPFQTHINAWNMNMYLSISPELYLKRLIVGGYEKVFTICKNFRNEGVDHSHNPEFTMLEAYWAYADYNDVMALVEECFEYVAMKVNGTTVCNVVTRDSQGKQKIITIDVKAPWRKITMREAIIEKTQQDVSTMTVDQLEQFCLDKRLDTKGARSWGDFVLLIFEELVEKEYIEPIHIIDRPKESTPLCKKCRYDERLVEQDEPAIAGMEVGNIYSELNDPVVQRRLLEEQASQLRGGDEEAHPMDEDFARCLEFGMPPTGGLGLGIDRMVMILTGQATLRDVILFPTMKPEVETTSDVTKKSDVTEDKKTPQHLVDQNVNQNSEISMKKKHFVSDNGASH